MCVGLCSRVGARESGVCDGDVILCCGWYGDRTNKRFDAPSLY